MGKDWEVGSHTVSIVWVFFPLDSHPSFFPLYSQTSSYVKCMCFLIYFPYHSKCSNSRPWKVNFMLSHQNSSCSIRFWQKYTFAVLCGLKVCECANFSTVFFQSVFMKILNSWHFQTIGLTQSMQLLTSQTWLIKTF